MNDIEHQRKYFSKLTEEFYQIVKKNDWKSIRLFNDETEQDRLIRVLITKIKKCK